MIIFVVFLVVQILLLLVFAPIRFGVKLHFSLNREQMLVVFAVGKLKVVKLKICKLDERLALIVNGRQKSLRLNKSTPQKANVAMTYAKAQRLFKLFKFTIFSGAQDASHSALATGVIKSLSDLFGVKCEFFTDFERERCDFVVIARAKVNLYEALELYFKTKCE